MCSAELAGEREQQQHLGTAAEAQAQVQHLQQELAQAKRQLHESQELAEGQLQVGFGCGSIGCDKAFHLRMHDWPAALVRGEQALLC